MNTNLTEADLAALRRLVEAVQRLTNKIGGVSSQLFAVEMAALNLPADILDRLTPAEPKVYDGPERRGVPSRG